jgi:hypothetical protein
MWEVILKIQDEEDEGDDRIVPGGDQFTWRPKL